MVVRIETARCRQQQHDCTQGGGGAAIARAVCGFKSARISLIWVCLMPGRRPWTSARHQTNSDPYILHGGRGTNVPAPSGADVTTGRECSQRPRQVEFRYRAMPAAARAQSPPSLQIDQSCQRVSRRAWIRLRSGSLIWRITRAYTSIASWISRDCVIAWRVCGELVLWAYRDFMDSPTCILPHRNLDPYSTYCHWHVRELDIGGKVS